MKKNLIFFLLIIIAVVVTIFVIPTSISMTRSITINRPQAEVFEFILSLKNQDLYSKWAKLDPNMKNEYKGEDRTVGFVNSWSGNEEVGEGEQEITAIDLMNSKVEYELRFKKPFEATNKAFMQVLIVDSMSSKVEWGFSGDMPRPFNLLSKVMRMEESIASDYDTGLKNLKALLEK